MTILICTVGGSPAPIVTALARWQPSFTVFVCSEEDPTSEKKGSASSTQVEGKGPVCTSGPNRAPDLPNIPTQAGLAPGSWEVLLVPADDPAIILRRITAKLRDMLERGGGEIVADYTGGTKSMTAGLFAAALLTPGIGLSLVGGPRLDLVRVTDGLEAATRVDAEAIRGSWRLAEARRAWTRFGYAEAARILDQGGQTDPDSVRARSLSRGYALWDAFDHAEAYRMLKPLGRFVAEGLMPALAILANDMSERGTAYRIWDVLFMAERRAAGQQYDTAVLLVYRALEWIAQWSLREHQGIDASDVHDEPATMTDLVHVSHTGKRVIGLHNAWTALGRLAGPFSEVGRATDKTRLTFAELRNTSLFAHGVRPMSKADFAQARSWFDQNVLPSFLAVSFAGKPPFGQLPTSF